MSSDLQKTQEFIEAFGILSTNLGQDDIYKRILLEVIFEELFKNSKKDTHHGSE